MQEFGVMKVSWSDVRASVARVEPQFAAMVDQINPDASFALYKVYYPYGAVIADPIQMYLAKDPRTVTPLRESDFGCDVMTDLSYGKDSWAMGMVLAKNIEVFIDFKDNQTSIPWMIYKPGTLFPFSRLLNNTESRNYAPNNILTIVSGVRSTFMLPNIGCNANHINLQKDYHIQLPAPKSLYEHWQIFKAINSSFSVESDWYSCLLYFSQKWVDHVRSDPAWREMKMYLHDLAWRHFEFRRNQIYYDIAYSRIQQRRNLKPNPYLIDTAAHLYKTALGDVPGFSPANNQDSLPLDVIQKAYVESYDLKKYLPTIMQPDYFMPDHQSDPVYYSLQNPSTFVFSPKSRKVSSTLFEMHELDHILRVFQDELLKEDSLCHGTVLSEIAENIRFKFFHNEIDKHGIIYPSEEIIKDDHRFCQQYSSNPAGQAEFAADAKFLRGCIGIYGKS